MPTTRAGTTSPARDSGFVEVGSARYKSAPVGQHVHDHAAARGRGAVPPARCGHLRVARGRRRSCGARAGAPRRRIRTPPARTRPASARQRARSLDPMPAAADEPSMSNARRRSTSSPSGSWRSPPRAPWPAPAHPGLWATVNLCDTAVQAGRRRRPRVDPARAAARRSSGPASACSGSTATSAPGAWCAPAATPASRASASARASCRGARPSPSRCPSRARGSSCAGSSTSSGAMAREVVDHARLNTTAGHRDGKDRQRRVSRSSCEITR